jgi:uncharacterized protein
MVAAIDTAFLQRVKETIQTIDPTAEVWLFGSRARGDAREDSDWDFLIFTEQDLSDGRRWIFSDQLNDVGLGSEAIISTIVWPKQDRKRYAVTDLYLNVMDEGIQL